ncbi:ATP-dependent DNA helicase, RecQ family [Rhodoblastus acidophilus]|uniref:ATP-dependent DNA helicase, RecQ family n=1 Tax=Rhodoblastus acidophilus TaxID=1074 RepID=A0A212SA95_RHOAC|nr:protein DpdF [Rhodoblastus acidophilus]PPQ35823.1 ATP-dependent DNA helicase RecQ [Rhodoblastus acidophilus]RAI17983.1 ATP-dependent DNA helicase RecQ [Rhodoblastus acidophilus]SNB82439.1 ATP-dependent DNA helicase, RecQ family [Rhodoblastus acidophilus]
MNCLNFSSLHDLLAQWPECGVPLKSADGVFERIRQILHGARAAGTPGNFSDFMALLRHVLRRQSLQSGSTARLRVPFEKHWPDRDQWSQFGIRAHQVGNSQYLIEAVPWSPNWVADVDAPLFEDAFAERKVRLDRQRPIDPFLGEASGFECYMSPGQREAVRSAFLLPPGKTLIIGLPTGSGKSLVAQAPVLTRGLEGPMTICVVPTTALALDQSRQTAGMLKVRYPRLDAPILAWHAGLTSEERAAVKTAIRQGTQGILYCSPEAVTGALLPALYDAAESGLLAYLVIDEAHLISQWGDGFRPAFQMLAGIRRGLLAKCGKRPFKTLLMSATLTPETVGTIDAIFGPAESVQMVASIYLRPEPQYWIHRESDPAAKTAKVLESIRHAPRPTILYVTKREDADAWLDRLRRAGFVRCASFHGNTDDISRRRIIDQWASNELDIIVATSAFGVGIDKPDVRAIIHAAVPETLDRYYQEIGRGGRDGRTSASLLLYSDVDREIADRLAAPSIISDELAFDRWSAMSASATRLDVMGMLLQVDLSVVPKRLNRQTDYNETWNMRTLIMMARANMLELESRPPEMIARNEDETDASYELRNEEHWAKYFLQAVVSLSEMGHRNQTVFDSRIGTERARSVASALSGRLLLDALLGGKIEVSDLLHDLYTSHAPRRTVLVSRACGGCPADRRKRRFADPFYTDPNSFGIEDVEPPDTSLFQLRFPHLSIKSPVVIALPDSVRSAQIVDILADLVSTFEIREIAIPDAMRGIDGIRLLHRHAVDRVVLLQSLEEEADSRPTVYQLARASVINDQISAEPLMLLERPLHLILAPPSAQNPFNPGRRLIDTGNNILTFDQFMAGARL